MLDLHSSKGRFNPSALAFSTLFILGALIALAAELPYGGWVQIPLLSLVWWRLSLQTEGLDRKSTRLNSSHSGESRMPSSA